MILKEIASWRYIMEEFLGLLAGVISTGFVAGFGGGVFFAKFKPDATKLWGILTRLYFFLFTAAFSFLTVYWFREGGPGLPVAIAGTAALICGAGFWFFGRFYR